MTDFSAIETVDNLKVTLAKATGNSKHVKSLYVEKKGIWFKLVQISGNVPSNSEYFNVNDPNNNIVTSKYSSFDKVKEQFIADSKAETGYTEVTLKLAKSAVPNAVGLYRNTQEIDVALDQVISKFTEMNGIVSKIVFSLDNLNK